MTHLAPHLTFDGFEPSTRDLEFMEAFQYPVLKKAGLNCIVKKDEQYPVWGYRGQIIIGKIMCERGDGFSHTPVMAVADALKECYILFCTATKKEWVELKIPESVTNILTSIPPIDDEIKELKEEIAELKKELCDPNGTHVQNWLNQSGLPDVDESSTEE